MFTGALEDAVVAVAMAAALSAIMHFFMFETSKLQRSLLAAIASAVSVILFHFAVFEPTPFLFGLILLAVASGIPTAWVVSAALSSRWPR